MTEMNEIIIKGARTHNLKNISLKIPKHQVVVFTGVSGSGKSSLVFDTIYTEAQRQLVETFSTFARSRMPKLTRPDIEEIQNISTAIVIDQRRLGTNLRSTVGTATEINTYLRLLYSRCGDKFIGPSFRFGFNHPEGMCPSCHGLGKKIAVDTEQLINWDKTIREGAVNHPDYKVGGWQWREMVAIGLFCPDQKIRDFSEKELADFLYAEAIPVEKNHGAGTYTKNYEGIIRKLERLYLNKAEDTLSSARQDAYEKYFHYTGCRDCGGSRLNALARSVKINGKNIAELQSMELTRLDAFLATIDGEVARPMVSKVRQILAHLIEIGVGYLSLNRTVATLSGGESQRVKMARQLDCDLVDMIYVLDEPSIGLHSRDTDKLIQMLYRLKEKGNSVFVVEHDPDIIQSAEWIVDIGPRAGSHGGELIYNGPFEGLLKTGSITGKYLNRNQRTPVERKKSQEYIFINNVAINNLKSVSVKIPKAILTCVTGVAGSGKSSLVNGYFVKQYQDAIVIDQSMITGNVRSNPATYIGVFDMIRKEFARVTHADPALFSFNSKGACPKCNGKGYIELEMHFLDEMKIVCDECEGKRYTGDVLALTYQTKNIFDVLNMTVDQAAEFFPVPEIQRRLKVLADVGLGYLEIGQPLSTLSGGEAQRIKLASELRKKGNLYVMDEPTTGLHLADIDRLLAIIKRLVANNNTVVIIEHNMEIISQADWIIDLGPEGGARGGEVLFEGAPEDLMQCERSYTGKYLKKYLA
jgi:excinuclease UvrABC ATPase subunit